MRAIAIAAILFCALAGSSSAGRCDTGVWSLCEWVHIDSPGASGFATCSNAGAGPDAFAIPSGPYNWCGQFGKEQIDRYQARCWKCCDGWAGPPDCVTNINECGSTDRCDRSTTQCVDLPGSYRCDCLDGYTVYPDTPRPYSCSNINECAVGTASCDTTRSTCVDLSGSNGKYMCQCNAGWTRGSDQYTCVNIDECASGAAHCDPATTRCRDTDGDFACDCVAAGYRRINKLSCAEIDECREGTAGCEQVCTNTIGSFSCSCNDGYIIRPSNAKKCITMSDCCKVSSECSPGKCLDYMLDAAFEARIHAVASRQSLALTRLDELCTMKNPDRQLQSLIADWSCRIASMLRSPLGLDYLGFRQNEVTPIAWAQYDPVVEENIKIVESYEASIRHLQQLRTLGVSNDQMRAYIDGRLKTATADIISVINEVNRTLSAALDSGFKAVQARIDQTNQILVDQGNQLREIQAAVLENGVMIRKCADEIEQANAKIDDLKAEVDDMRAGSNEMANRFSDGKKGWDANGDGMVNPSELLNSFGDLRQLRGSASDVVRVFRAAQASDAASVTCDVLLGNVGPRILGPASWKGLQDSLHICSDGHISSTFEIAPFDGIITIPELVNGLRANSLLGDEAIKLWDKVAFTVDGISRAAEGKWTTLLETGGAFFDDAFRKLSALIPSAQVNSIMQNVVGILGIVKAGVPIVSNTVKTCGATVGAVAQGGLAGLVIATVSGDAIKCIVGVADTVKFIVSNVGKVITFVKDVVNGVVSVVKSVGSVVSFFGSLFGRRRRTVGLDVLGQHDIPHMMQLLSDLQAMNDTTFAALDMNAHVQNATYPAVVPPLSIDSQRLRSYLDALAVTLSSSNDTSPNDVVNFVELIGTLNTYMGVWQAEAVRALGWENVRVLDTAMISSMTTFDYDVMLKAYGRKLQNVAFNTVEQISRQVRQLRYLCLENTLLADDLAALPISPSISSIDLRTIKSAMQAAYLNCLTTIPGVKNTRTITHEITIADAPAAIDSFRSTGSAVFVIPVPPRSRFARARVVSAAVYVYPATMSTASAFLQLDFWKLPASYFFDGHGSQWSFVHTDAAASFNYQGDTCAYQSVPLFDDATRISYSPYGPWKVRLTRPLPTNVTTSRIRAVRFEFVVAFAPSNALAGSDADVMEQLKGAADKCPSNCDATCATCTGSAPSNCLTCVAGYEKTANGTCVPCAAGTFYDGQAAVCKSCYDPIGCIYCTGAGQSQCYACRDGFVLGTSGCVRVTPNITTVASTMSGASVVSTSAAVSGASPCAQSAIIVTKTAAVPVVTTTTTATVIATATATITSTRNVTLTSTAPPQTTTVLACTATSTKSVTLTATATQTATRTACTATATQNVTLTATQTATRTACTATATQNVTLTATQTATRTACTATATQSVTLTSTLTFTATTTVSVPYTAGYAAMTTPASGLPELSTCTDMDPNVQLGLSITVGRDVSKIRLRRSGDGVLQDWCLCSALGANCTVSNWTSWSPCNVSCGTGVSRRTREIVSPASGNGTPCPSLEETRVCSMAECDVDCVVSDWTDWGACSRLCGGGAQDRNRTIVRASSGNGVPCGTLREVRACNSAPCVDYIITLVSAALSDAGTTASIAVQLNGTGGSIPLSTVASGLASKAVKSSQLTGPDLGDLTTLSVVVNANVDTWRCLKIFVIYGGKTVTFVCPAVYIGKAPVTITPCTTGC